MNSVQLLNTAADMAFYTEKFAPGSGEALGKAVSFGLPFSLFGFAVVFGVLALLMVIIIAFGKIFGAAEAKASSKPAVKEEPKKQEAKAEQPAVVEAAPAPVASGNDIVAAIIAAITSFRAANGEAGGFRVVSFKKRK